MSEYSDRHKRRLVDVSVREDLEELRGKQQRSSTLRANQAECFVESDQGVDQHQIIGIIVEATTNVRPERQYDEDDAYINRDLSSESDEEDSISNQAKTVKFLQQWSAKHKISQIANHELLQHLKPCPHRNLYYLGLT